MIGFATDMKLRLREVRESQFISQTELAERAKIGRATIARIEGGTLKTDPRWVTIRKLAAALEVSPADLIVKDT